MKKIIFIAALALVSVMNINAASAKAASEKIQQIRTEQSILQDQALESNDPVVAEQSILQDQALESNDPVVAMNIMKDVIALDKQIESMIPSLLAERENLRDAALACGNDVVKAMEITRKVIAIDNLLEEIGYEEPMDE